MTGIETVRYDIALAIDYCLIIINFFCFKGMYFVVWPLIFFTDARHITRYDHARAFSVQFLMSVSFDTHYVI